MKVGVIGLGAMGHGMALNFHKAGYLHRVWNRTQIRAVEFAKQTGIVIADSPESLAQECELLLTCVSRDGDVIEVMEQIAKGINPGVIVVDSSTTSRETAIKAAEILAQKGAHFLDGPVSGGTEGAKKGTLSMMIGGEQQVLEDIRETLTAIATNIIYLGATGSGQATKAVNQILCAGINQTVTEALSFGVAMGLDMDKVIDAVSKGAAGNWFLEHRGKTMLAGSFAAGFKVNLHHKDLMICSDMATALDEQTLPLSEMTLEHYQQLMDDGYGDEDISALYRLKK